MEILTFLFLLIAPNDGKTSLGKSDTIHVQLQSYPTEATVEILPRSGDLEPHLNPVITNTIVSTIQMSPTVSEVHMVSDIPNPRVSPQVDTTKILESPLPVNINKQ